MRAILAFTFLFVPMAFGQTPADPPQDRVLTFNHTDNPQTMQQLTTVIRGMADITQISLDNAQKSVTVHGTAGQLDLAAWLFEQLDRESTRKGQAPDPAAYDYAAPRGDTAVRVLQVEHIEGPQAVQELVNLLRGIGDVQRIFPLYWNRAIVLRTTPARAELAEWLAKELDAAAGQQISASARPTASRDLWEDPAGATAVRISYLVQPLGPQGFIQMMQSVRAKADIQRMFPFTPARAVAFRGAPDKVAVAERLLRELDQPAPER